MFNYVAKTKLGTWKSLCYQELCVNRVVDKVIFFRFRGQSWYLEQDAQFLLQMDTFNNVDGMRGQMSLLCIKNF